MKMYPYALTPPNQLGKRGAHFNEFKKPRQRRRGNYTRQLVSILSF